MRSCDGAMLGAFDGAFDGLALAIADGTSLPTEEGIALL